MNERLSDDDIATRVAGGSWERVGDAITRTWHCPDFSAAIAFVGRVADAAERADHHPDILVHGWNRVTLTLSTHSAGGLTDADFALAEAIDRLEP